MTTHPKAEDLRGWLKRKGGRMKTWSRRWFVLTDKFLFIFLRDDDRRSQDCITLSGQLIVEPTVDPADTCRGYFDIVTEYDKGITETLSLCAETEEEKHVWMRALKRALYADKGGALFSQSLEEILYWEHSAGRHIPYIVDECIEYLYKFGLDVEGIFRLPGRQSAAKDIISRFERGQKIKFEDEGTDVHVVASVLKAFLRSLPDSIIPCHLFQKFMNIALRFTEAKDEGARDISVQELTEALKLLSKDSYTILKYICRFLRVVGQHEPTNKMSMMSLGTVFSYNILRHIDKENNHLFLLTADLGQNLVYMLLKYYTKVFSREHCHKEDTEDENSNKDLLRMSRPVDTPVLSPNICLSVNNNGTVEQSTESSLQDNTRSYELCITDDDAVLPAGSEKTNVEFDGGAIACGSVHETRICHQEKKNLHLNLLSVEGTCVTERGIARSYSSSSLREVCSVTVSPRRLKSRIARNRYFSDRRRPGPIMLDADDWLPRDRHSPGGVNSEDVIIALAQAQTSPQNADSPAFSFPRVHSCQSLSLDFDCVPAFDNSVQALDESPGFELEPEEKARQWVGMADLLKQVTTLKEELSRHRDQHRVQISALKTQLDGMIDKYEHKITAIQMNYKSQIKELESKLAEEKESYAAAIAESVKLKEKMQKYQVLYGELS